MKALFLSLLKFNFIVALAYGAWVLLVIAFKPFRYDGPEALFIALILLIIGWCVVGNLRIIIKSKKVIVDAVKDGSIEVAASALDFREAAAERVKQRRQERASRRDEADRDAGSGD